MERNWKTERIKINIPSKKVTHLLVRMERLLRNWFGNSGSSNQKVYCICNKGTQIFYSDLAMNCTDKKSAIRSFWEIYKVAPCLKCSYEWRRSVRGFRSGCKLFITEALKVLCFCFVGIQKRLNIWITCHLCQLFQQTYSFPNKLCVIDLWSNCWVAMPQVTWNCCLFMFSVKFSIFT